MAMVINTNMGSLNAVRLLDVSSRDQATAMERLTSGLRINSAADDAAGLAVSESMTVQIRGTEMATRNANDGISLIQTIDGAIEEVSSMLQRMRELTVQSLTETYTDANRDQMQLEFAELDAEIVRVGETTKFNGISLLEGTNATIAIHVGWEDGANDHIDVTTADVTGLASSGGSVATAALAATALGNLDTDITAINDARSTWGATQNRLESTVSNLQNVTENMKAARSQILDTDFATESANLARTQVLQQAGMSMLSQANQSSQNVMQLLQ
ncbi:MAG: flagellin [Pseudomonadota bacterium]|nr:flagellin [Pseudomonadota bacterium]